MRYFIDLCYDGAAYHGWQKQPNASSVQETIENALSLVLRQSIEIVGAGRTDTGVNASMMIAHFDLDDNKLEIKELVKKLNRLLPCDIAIKGIEPVSDLSHARFSATSRLYRYYVTTDKQPFARHYAWRIPFDVDIELMNKACELLFDYKDFTSFSKLHTDVKTNDCKIMLARWLVVDKHTYCFEIKADRFLRNMVRAIVGTMLDVGRKKISLKQFCEIIESKDRCNAGSSVPPYPLFLAEIKYPDDICGLH